MASVYVETTIPSYLVARPSRDIVVAAHQQITLEWWRSARSRFDLFVSEAVVAEVRQGDPDFAARRLELLSDLPVLAFDENVGSLLETYERELGLDGAARADLPHIAFAVAYELDYLVTWNCKHLANGQVIRRLATVNSRIGRQTPIVLTPEELPAEPDGAVS